MSSLRDGAAGSQPLKLLRRYLACGITGFIRHLPASRLRYTFFFSRARTATKSDGRFRNIVDNSGHSPSSSLSIESSRCRFRFRFRTDIQNVSRPQSIRRCTRRWLLDEMTTVEPMSAAAPIAREPYPTANSFRRSYQSGITSDLLRMHKLFHATVTHFNPANLGMVAL
jgi:hypothetical protein